jgi:hypothetical protein
MILKDDIDSLKMIRMYIYIRIYGRSVTVTVIPLSKTYVVRKP